MKKITLLGITLLVAIAVCLTLPSSEADAVGEEPKVLMDKGNGQTYWSVASGDTLDEVFTAAFSENGMSFSSSGTVITVDGLTSRTLGTTTSSWNYYVYSGGSWVKTDYSGSAAYSDSYIAVGFYPSDLKPTVTPGYKNAWTCIHGDSLNSSAYTNYEPSPYNAEIHYTYGENDSTVPACYASPLYANSELVLLSAEYKGKPSKAHMICIDMETGDTKWDNTYNVSGYILMTPAIYGDCAYFTSVSGWVYKIPLSGENEGTIVNSVHLQVSTPDGVDMQDGGTTVMIGLSSIVYDSGHLFFGSSGGQIYCLDTDLNTVWSYQMTGAVYPSTSISVANGMVYVGACDGKLYILDETTGALKDSVLVYYNDGGRVGTPAVLGDYIIVSYNDGKGMSASYWGAAVYRYNSGHINLVKKLDDLTIQGNYLVIAPGGGYVYGLGVNGSNKPALFRIYTNGGYEELFQVSEIHGGMTLVNNTYFYGTDYDSYFGKKKDHNYGKIRVYNMSGEQVNTFDKPESILNYSMGSIFVCGEYIATVTDSGAFVLKGTLVDGTDPPGPVINDVEFLICDGTGFYQTIKGSGVTVIDALADATDTYNYINHVEYGGTPPSSLKSLFGMSHHQITETEYSDWLVFQWDDSEDYWIQSVSAMSAMPTGDYPYVLLYYGTTDGSPYILPSGLPKSSELQPLIRSNDGVRFMIESDTGEYFVMNGTGTTLRDALVQACDANGIPYSFDGDKVTFFGKAATSEKAWNQYAVDGSNWILDTTSMSDQSAADIEIYGLFYGSSSTLPTIPVSDVSDRPLPASVKFLICDGTEFYLVIEGDGLMVMDAFMDAVDSYRYTKYTEYSGTPAHPDSLKSMFGLTMTQVSETEYLYWITCIWDGGSDYWTASSETMAQLYAIENQSVLLYYGRSDGMSFDIPAGLPHSDQLHPLKRSDEGVRFLIESDTGAFFVMNGTGYTLRDALTQSCEANSIPYSFNGDTVTLFGRVAASEKAWNQYTVDNADWTLDTRGMSGLYSDDFKVYALYYAPSSSIPTIPVNDISDEPFPAHVKFLICDGTEFYLVIEGEGLMIIDAFVDAVNDYGYAKYTVYSGTQANPESIKSMFGLTFKQHNNSEYSYWWVCTWDADLGYWSESSDNMDQLYASENQTLLLYYGRTDGMIFDIPAGLPKTDELRPLQRSDDGVRFLIESDTGAFFIVNGTGSTLRDALEDGLTTNSIPYAFDGDSITLFNKAATSDVAWNRYSASSSGWSLDTSILSDESASGVKVYALYYGSASTLPSIAVEDIYDGNLSNVKEDYVPIILAIVVAVIIIAFLVYLYRKARTHNMSMVWAFKDMIKPSNTSSKTKQNKIRLLIVCIVGLILTAVMFLCSLAIGPSVTLSLPETFKALVSAIGKSGKDLTFQEIVVYQTRLPRTLAVLAVGIGLSIAGCVYQAIIRNPLVDPYIMGVSSGAGTFAVAAIAADFTFFGILANTTYATPILAIVGGLLAFGMTLLIAERAGGSSTNYVLAGVVIGLVFSAIQTVLLVTAKSNKLMSAISWLFGSFANVGWDTVWIIVFPALLLSIVPLIWAKELNLVLLGEDQAKQMGLNVRKFNRWMLILASVLTSVCVAFVGIIGFVGMVIPHLCRMILGGDHRLVLPSSIILGGALLLFADLMAKMLMIPTELPVGAITTIIGVPVFAYLLIKKGRMYSG